ncbi:hypothetical protein H4219_002651 [Mycoemilia scoparia]|uniref:Uncharacterized protein n=1 Tax=Mycoemilia scoparia TaxID=417184 RepID=A0A9W8A3G9_9FUNG|nr:hypothetical protein H4219_002651 [Mycoemilia scoparia]
MSENSIYASSASVYDDQENIADIEKYLIPTKNAQIDILKWLPKFDYYFSDFGRKARCKLAKKLLVDHIDAQCGGKVIIRPGDSDLCGGTIENTSTILPYSLTKKATLTLVNAVYYFSTSQKLANKLGRTNPFDNNFGKYSNELEFPYIIIKPILFTIFLQSIFDIYEEEKYLGQDDQEYYTDRDGSSSEYTTDESFDHVLEYQVSRRESSLHITNGGNGIGNSHRFDIINFINLLNTLDFRCFTPYNIRILRKIVENSPTELNKLNTIAKIRSLQLWNIGFINTGLKFSTKIYDGSQNKNSHFGVDSKEYLRCILPNIPNKNVLAMMKKSVQIPSKAAKKTQIYLVEVANYTW